jgi:hypothetical protein
MYSSQTPCDIPYILILNPLEILAMQSDVTIAHRKPQGSVASQNPLSPNFLTWLGLPPTIPE